MLAYVRDDLQEQGLTPPYAILYAPCGIQPVEFDSYYECWQPDLFDGGMLTFNKDIEDFNMVILYPCIGGFMLLAVNSIDFEWKHYHGKHASLPRLEETI